MNHLKIAKLLRFKVDECIRFFVNANWTTTIFCFRFDHAIHKKKSPSLAAATIAGSSALPLCCGRRGATRRQASLIVDRHCADNPIACNQAARAASYCAPIIVEDGGSGGNAARCYARRLSAALAVQRRQRRQRRWRRLKVRQPRRRVNGRYLSATAECARADSSRRRIKAASRRSSASQPNICDADARSARFCARRRRVGGRLQQFAP